MQLKSPVLVFTFMIATAFLFQNCSKTHFVLEDQAEFSAGIQCTADQVQDLSGQCVNGNALAQACQLNGQLIGNGNSVLVYQASTVPAGSKCVSETRTCQNGQLSGSFTNLSCQVLSPSPTTSSGPPMTMLPAPCFFNGTRVESGSSITAYQSPAATTCQSQQRKCTNGNLSGNFVFSSCTPMPPTASCSFNGKSMKIGESVTAYQAPAATANMACRPEQRVCQPNGNLTGSFAYNSCTPYRQPTSTQMNCTQTELLAAQRSFVEVVKVTPSEVAKSCVDLAVPTIEGSYPTTPDLYLRFANTCGNRACKERGFISGRMAEMNTEGIFLECRNDQVPATITDSCRQRLVDLPKPIEEIPMADTAVAQLCGLSVLPSDTMGLINWVYTCGNRVCRNQGYSSGRIIEYANGKSILECAREERINTMSAGTLVQFINSNVETISQKCIDDVTPTAADSYPSKSPSTAIRFYNTCGRRYCIQQGFRTGRVTELSGQNVQLVCMK